MKHPVIAAVLWVGLSACSAHQAASSSKLCWESPLHADHPLVGKVFEVETGQPVPMEALEGRVAEADFVLLGETHDNPDHHLLQARLLEAAAAERKPAVAFEMLDVSQQPQVDTAVAAHPDDPEVISAAVDWDHSGWPAFSMYRPIFEVALKHRLPIVAANLSREDARRLMKEGQGALPPELAARLKQEEPVPEPILASLREEMAGSHCGAMPESMIDPLVLAQRARDVQLAQRMDSAGGDQGAVLIAGAGHVRNDRGVPWVLEKDVSDRKVLSVGMLEVIPGETALEAYARRFGTEKLPFDYVVFTPAMEREDPCEQFRKHHPKPPAPPPSAT